MKDNIIIEMIKKNLGPHWKFKTVTSSLLSRWTDNSTRKCKDILERLEKNGWVIQSGREDASNKIEKHGTTCIQYSIVSKIIDKDKNFPVGSWVNHHEFGDGEIIFSKSEFPKVKVLFSGLEKKVYKSELTRVSSKQ